MCWSPLQTLESQGARKSPLAGTTPKVSVTLNTPPPSEFWLTDVEGYGWTFSTWLRVLYQKP
jgi:hypothetical protein